MTTKVPLTHEERSTIRMALLFWEERCRKEAEVMGGWAVEYGDKGDAETADKCNRNAAASREFQSEARALLDGDKL